MFQLCQLISKLVCDATFKKIHAQVLHADAGYSKHMFSSYKQNFELVVKNQIQNSCMNFNKYYEHNGISTTDATHANGFIVQKWKGSSAVCK